MKRKYIAGILLIFLSTLAFYLGTKFQQRQTRNTESKSVVKTEILEFHGNDFVLELLPSGAQIEKSAGADLLNQSIPKVFEQSAAAQLWDEYEINLVVTDASPHLENNGGLKRVFRYKSDLIGYFALKKIENDCYFSSLVNLTKKFEILRGECLPVRDGENLDFNGAGGAHAEINGALLFAIGTPTTDTPLIAKLAQDSKSFYGKIVRIPSARILSSKHKTKETIQIFSSGHRNPQGMININGEIYAAEHGPKGGDELNRISELGNYGWPNYSLGSKYAGAAYKIAGKDAMILPSFAFIPSIGISDLTKCPISLQTRYSPLVCILAGSLRAESIFVVLINPKNQNVISAERINIGMRIRNFFNTDESEVYISTDHNKLYKLIFTNVANFQ